MLTRIVLFATVLGSMLTACAGTPTHFRDSSIASGGAGASTAKSPGGEAAPGSPAVRPDATMLRYPDVSATHIVFVYANDIWLVPREGGVAVPLASPPGLEMLPKFSENGQTIAFVGNYDGGRDLYTLPVAGGVPTRVTYHPAPESLCGWTPDGRLLYASSGFSPFQRELELFTVAAGGGLPVKLPVPYGANGAISPDGRWLAYTPHSTDERTWKRYRGGMATDIWLFDLRDHKSRKITEWEGTDSLPMWRGEDVFYLSDGGPEHRLNIWRWDSKGGQRRQVTAFKEFDVKWPSMGPGPGGRGEIVFQNGPDLYLLDLATDGAEARRVSITVPGDRPKIRARQIEAFKTVTAADVSPTGKRGVFEARGDIWTAPAQKGTPRNLNRTSGAAERDPAWSPDGQWVAYFSDATGEYELYIAQSDGRGETKQVTRGSATFYYGPTWSPDSKRIAFTDKSGAIHLATVESGEAKVIDTDPYAHFGRLNWSGDSRWVAYVKMGDNRLTSVWLYDASTGQSRQVTSGRFNDSWPTFDRKGDYLYFASNRKFVSPAYADVDSTFIYADTDVLLAVPLRAEVGSPWAPKSDEETWGEQKEEAKEDKDKEKKEADEKEEKKAGDSDETKKAEEIKPVEIELDGFEQRCVLAPVEKGSFSNLNVNHEGKLLYVRNAVRGSDGKPAIKILDPKDEKKEEKTVVEGTGSLIMSADGKKLLVHKDDTWAIVDAADDQKLDKPMSLSGMVETVEPQAEWRQMFVEAWRLQRDFFYDPHMHGVDWAAIRERYGRMIDDCTSREDVSYVIGEMIAELNVGHAYVWDGGDGEAEPKTSVGMLGVDFALENGAYRIARIYQGGPWDVDGRGPLSQPGVKVAEGDYVLAVNSVPVDTSKDPWAAFVGLGGSTITLTISDKPAIDETARQVVVEALGDEQALRYRAWVERNRAYIAEKSGGRIGYIHVPDTGVNGQNELFRQFFGQTDAAALIVDDRWNRGGQIPSRFIELLNRPVLNYWAQRDGKDTSWPRDGHFGPKCMLINGLAGSGGDCFPYYFRQAKLGKLIGTRTWGGLVGISGNPGLIDGGAVTVPTFAFYETDGTWGVEGHGVDPDIEVIDDPALMVEDAAGEPSRVHDPQIEAAIAHLLTELEQHPYRRPARPAYPDRSGMGVREEDK